MVYLNFPADSSGRSIQFDHIKAWLQIAVMAGQIKLGRAKNPPLFGAGDKLPRLRKFRIFSQLNLGKYNELPFFCNYIDLSAAAGVVPFQDAVAAKAQIAGGLILAPGSQALFINQCWFFRKLGRWLGQGPNLRIAS